MTYILYTIISYYIYYIHLYTAFDFMRELQVRNTRIAVSLDEPGAYAAMEAIVGSSDGAHVLQRTAGLPQCFSFITL